MAISSGTSFIVASITAVLIFSGMQMYKHFIVSNHIMSMLGGYMGALFFSCILTAVGNLETCIFGKAYQVKIFPEVIGCFGLALLLTASLHRVCFTTCFLCSSLALYYMNRYSQKIYSVPTTQVSAVGERKKRK